MKRYNFSPAEVEHIILLAWADSVTFDTITEQYGLTYDDIRHFMHRHQSEKTYARWRERVEGRGGQQSKHAAKTAITHHHQKLSI